MTVQTRYLEEDDKVIVQRWQNVGAIVDYAKACHNQGFHGGPDHKVVATIPPVAIEHFLNVQKKTLRDWITDPGLRQKFLNDPDYGDLRIWKGRV